MKNILSQFKGQFGKVENLFAFSPVTGGLAIKKSAYGNDFVSYQDGHLVDVSGLTLDFKVPAFKLPVAAADVKEGDIIQNGVTYVFVTAVADGYVEGVDPARNEKVSALPTTNLFFGQAFYTVVRTIDSAGAGFDPTMLMLLSDGGSKDDLLPFLLMSGGLGGQAPGQINPMMLMMLKDSTDDLLPLMLMQQGGVMNDGFNPLLLLLMDSEKGGSFKDLLPLMLMGQGANGLGGGQMNPMMMMMLMGDGKGGDMKDIMMMQALSGGNGFNLFGAK